MSIQTVSNPIASVSAFISSMNGGQARLTMGFLVA